MADFGREHIMPKLLLQPLGFLLLCALPLSAQVGSGAPMPMPPSMPEPMPMPDAMAMPPPDLETSEDTIKPYPELKADLAQAEAANDKEAIARALVALAVYHHSRGENEDALAYLNRALTAQRSIGSRGGEAATLFTLGSVYDDLGRKQQALDSLTSALSIDRDISDRNQEAQTLNRIGMVFYTLGEEQNARSNFQLAMPIASALENRRVLAATLDGLGLVDYTRGEEEAAQDELQQAMEIQLSTRDRKGQAATLTAMGLVYTYLGQHVSALETFRRAMLIEDETGDDRAAADALNNIGWAYDAMGDKQSALDYLNRALPIQESVKDIAGQGYTLDSMGLVYHHLGANQKAVDAYTRALPIERQAGDRDCEANSLWGLGDAERELGRMNDALRHELSALSLANAVGDSDLQGRVETTLMRYFRARQRGQTAIFFGMDAVNRFQQARRNISGLGRDVQAGFVQSKADTYRELAELLVQSDRLGQAERVLDLLKEQELKEVVRGAVNTGAASAAPLALSSAQSKARDQLAIPEKTAEGLSSQSIEYASLIAKENRTPEEQARLKTLDARIEAGNAEIEDFFEKTLYPELAQSGASTANEVLSAEESSVSGLQNALLELGPNVMGIRLLLGEQHVYALVVTARAQKKFVLDVKPADLREKVFQVRAELRTPASDPRPRLEDLYRIVVAPLEPELMDLEAHAQPGGPPPALLWSLDGVMRYLPMSAMYDGKRYLAERFNNVLVTPESYPHMADRPGPDSAALHVLAMGLTKSYGGLPALPGVMPELEAVVHDPAVAASHGPLEGRLLPDDRFTLDAMKQQLGSGAHYAVVHIASHFIEEAGNGQEPYLMMGGESEADAQGYELTLSKLTRSTISFHGTRLLTLSACSTASGDTRGDGMEMESLEMVAQKKDAQAVLATLWDVNDASTSRLMGDFYARWAAHPDMGKAEALRQAQLAFIHGDQPQASDAGNRGFSVAPPPAAAPPISGFAHPYYWAPFVLAGNFQ